MKRGLCEVRDLWRGALWSKKDAEPKMTVTISQEKGQRARLAVSRSWASVD